MRALRENRLGSSAAARFAATTVRIDASPVVEKYPVWLLLRLNRNRNKQYDNQHSQRETAHVTSLLGSRPGTSRSGRLFNQEHGGAAGLRTMRSPTVSL